MKSSSFHLVALLSIFLSFVGLSFGSKLEVLWKIEEGVKGPETVTYDPVRECLYVSNYDTNTPNEDEGTDFVSKLGLDGEVLELRWFDGLSSPLGMEIYEDRLYIVERWGVRVIDLATGEKERKIQIANTRFLNDLSVDGEGIVFVSDSAAGKLYRIFEDRAELWREGPEIAGVNGVMMDDGSLVIAVPSDHSLKRVDLRSKEVSPIARFERGLVDGIQKAKNGYLVSLYEGALYRVSDDGGLKLLLDTWDEGVYCANFLYLEELGLLVVPELRNDSITAYRLELGE